MRKSLLKGTVSSTLWEQRMKFPGTYEYITSSKLDWNEIMFNILWNMPSTLSCAEYNGININKVFILSLYYQGILGRILLLNTDRLPMKSLFQFDLHANYMWPKLATTDHSQKAKNLPMSQLSLQLPEYSCHSRDIHTIYAELLTPGGLLYVPSLSVVINLSFSASIGRPFIWCRRRCLGERFERELNRNKTKSREREREKQTRQR